MIEINKHILKVGQSGSVALNDKVTLLKSEGRKVICLNSGDPDFNTPEAIVAAAKEAMAKGLTHYANSRGSNELRIAVSEKLKTFNDAIYSAEDEILITCGAVHAYYLALKTIINEGDEIIIPDPSWVTHSNMVTVLGGKPVFVEAAYENNFFPTIESLQEAVTDRTKAVVINSPSNPTGAVAEKEYLSALVKFCIENNLFIIADEVYERIIFDGKENFSVGSFKSAKDNLILINSFSKSYAMTGWRIGYLAAPKFIVDEAIKASQYSITSLPPFIQQGAVAALTDSTVETSVEQMRVEYEARRDLVKNILNNNNGSKINAKTPAGAFYYFLNISEVTNNSIKFCEDLLEEEGVAVVPGAIYGKHGEGYIRFSLASAREDIIEGANKLIKWIENYKQ